MDNLKEAMQEVEKLTIEDGEIVSVQYKNAEEQMLLPGILSKPLPNHCEVKIELRPSPESRILVEIWLPLQDWNGDFLGTGNGGYAGEIIPLELANGIRRGYAAANTNLGTEPNIDKLIGKPERWIDFGYRATHLMTVVGKRVVKAFYGREAKSSLFIGGSTGGQQALMEAQRYPDDYDGILAIAPAHNRTNLHYGFIWNWLALTESDQSGFTPEQAQRVTEHLLEKYRKEGMCLPGDKFFSCPQWINLDPAVLNDCEGITEAQKQALKKIMQGPQDPVSHKKIISPIYTPGSEAVDLGLARQSEKESFSYEFFYLFRWVYGKDFDFRRFDFHEDVKRLDQALADKLNAVDVDLHEFRNCGGKMLMLHGMADPIIPYQDSLEYYNEVIEKDGGIEKTKEYFRYFPIPGLGHVLGGPGVQDITAHGFSATPKDKEHDALVALAEWVKNGTAPDCLWAVAFEDGSIINGILKDTYAYERPCYAYPDCAEYSGFNPNDPDSYCRTNFDIRE